jgi:hypothetical protein
MVLVPIPPILAEAETENQMGIAASLIISKCILVKSL